MKRLCLAALVTALVGGCVDTEHEFLTRTVCLESHPTVRLMPMTTSYPCGHSVCVRTTMTLMPTTVCDKKEVQTYRNPHYKPNIH